MTLTLASMIETARSAVREVPPAEAVEALDSGAAGAALDAERSGRILVATLVGGVAASESSTPATPL